MVKPLRRQDRMFIPISNTPRDYAWGSTTAIPEILGTRPSGKPEAELWLGAAEGSPSVILNPESLGGATNLAAWIDTDPKTALGDYAGAGRLPFLLKLLAAASPLSLQAHPTPHQAMEGYARENAAGIPLDSPLRNYKDSSAKPELIYALSEHFDALCGFRPVDQSRTIVKAFIDAAPADTTALEGLLHHLNAGDAPRTAFEWLLSRGEGVDAVVELVTELAPLVAGWQLETDTVTSLAHDYPGDPGVVISLLLNRVQLIAGEALYLPAGNIHAYLDGVGVELMAASDNVLRGGLTPKHIDVPELLSVLDFRPMQVPYLRPERPAAGVEVFRPDVPDFVLVRLTAAATWVIDGPAILLCTAGEFAVAGAQSSATISRGESSYVTPDEGRLAFTGTGTVFLSTTGGPS